MSAMTESPPSEYVKQNSVRCPQCTFDLGAHFGPSMPPVMRCPECGRIWVTKDLVDRRARLPSKLLLVFVALFGLPLMLTVLAILLGGNGILVFFVYPSSYAVIGGIHALIMLLMSVRIASRGAPVFATSVVVFALVYDTAIVLVLASLEWRT